VERVRGEKEKKKGKEGGRKKGRGRGDKGGKEAFCYFKQHFTSS
jgi:hypothetical protein